MFVEQFNALRGLCKRNYDHENAIKTAIALTVLASATLAMSACENTYKGAGRDLDNVRDEMKDGWN